jgi:hypothetical protein
MEVHKDQMKDVYTQEAKEETKEALDMVLETFYTIKVVGWKTTWF